jgi:hypothetical protein
MSSETKNTRQQPAAARPDASGIDIDTASRNAGLIPDASEAPSGHGGVADVQPDGPFRRRPGSSHARLISAKAKADRIALQREQRDADERAMAPLMAEIDRLEAAAREREDNESVSRCAMARLALRRDAYLRADELLQKVREAAKPKPTPDQRELLINVMAKHLGVDACQEALRRAKEHARRASGRI